MFVTLLLSVIVSAQPCGPFECKPKAACICPPYKTPVKKKIVVKPQPQPQPHEIVPQDQEQQQQQQQQNQQQQVVVVIQESQRQELVAVVPTAPPPSLPLGIGLRGAVGITCNPTVFGLLGVRGRILPLHLGLEVNTQFAYGHSAQVMVYPIQGPIAWHLDFGGLMYINQGPRFNLLAGTGVEVQLIPHLSLTIDWRMTMARPFSLADSLLRSQLLFGLLLHSW